MHLLTRAALCCLLAASLAACAPLGGLADRIWADLEPQLIPVINTAILAAVGSAIAAAGAVGAQAFKAIRDEKLVQSLYRTMENGLKARFARRIAEGGLAAATTAVTPGDLAEALDFTKKNNAKAVKALKQSDDALIDKILARAPEAKAAVVGAIDAVKAAG